jgi:hypothetical protein
MLKSLTKRFHCRITAKGQAILKNEADYLRTNEGRLELVYYCEDLEVTAEQVAPMKI